jgi:virginiamycin B lyase
MLKVGKFPLIYTLAAMPLLATQGQPAPAAPPPVETTLDRVTPDATFAILSVTDIGSSAESLWAVSTKEGSVVQIDPKAAKAESPIALNGSPCRGLASDETSLWVPLCGEAVLARIGLMSGSVTKLPLAGLSEGGGALATGVGSVWILSDRRGSLLRIDPAPGLPVADVYLPDGTSALAFGMDALWAAATGTHQVVRINPHNNVVEARIAVGQAPSAIAAAEDAVWSVNAGDGTVSRIDAKTNRVMATIDVGVATAGAAIVAGAGAAWVSAPGHPLVRIDARTNRITHRLTGEGGGVIAFAHRSIWMAVSDTTVWRIDPRFVAALR